MGPSYDCVVHESYQDALVAERGISVNKTESAGLDGSKWVSKDNQKGEFITWVSPFNERNQLHDISLGSWNQITGIYINCSPCIIVRIAAASDRVM